MKRDTSITLLMDGNFSRVGTEVYSPHMGFEKFAARFTQSFDEVRIAARSFPAARPVGTRVTGERTSFLDLGAHRGVAALLAGIPRLVARVSRTVAQADVLLIRFPGNIALLAMLICWWRGKRFSTEIVADPADYFSDAASRHPLRRIARAVHCWATRYAATHAQTVRYVTAYTLQLEYPAHDIRRVFGFSDVYLPDSMFDQAVGPANDPHHSFGIVNVAMMHNESKGHTVLIHAIARLRARGLNVHATLIGDGSLREKFVREAKQAGIDGAVHFAGSMGGDEVRAAVARHALFVLPSFQEGMPRAMLEAMALGVPVIATQVGGIAEVLEVNELVKPGDVAGLCDRIERVVKDPAFRRSEAQRHRSIARRFQFSTLQSQYLTYCAELKARSPT
ncbi:glycosyltransferase [Paraburkholderia sp. 2C]